MQKSLFIIRPLFLVLSDVRHIAPTYYSLALALWNSSIHPMSSWGGVGSQQEVDFAID